MVTRLLGSVSSYFHNLPNRRLEDRLLHLASKGEIEQLKKEMDYGVINSISVACLGKILVHIAPDEGANCVRRILDSEQAANIEQKYLEEFAIQLATGCYMSTSAIFLSSSLKEKISKDILELLLLNAVRQNDSTVVFLIFQLNNAAEISADIFNKAYAGAVLFKHIDALISILTHANRSEEECSKVYKLILKGGDGELAENFRDAAMMAALPIQFEDPSPKKAASSAVSSVNRKPEEVSSLGSNDQYEVKE